MQTNKTLNPLHCSYKIVQKVIRQEQFCSLVNIDLSVFAEFCLKPLVCDRVLGDKRQFEECDSEGKKDELSRRSL